MSERKYLDWVAEISRAHAGFAWTILLLSMVFCRSETRSSHFQPTVFQLAMPPKGRWVGLHMLW